MINVNQLKILLDINAFRNFNGGTSESDGLFTALLEANLAHSEKQDRPALQTMPFITNRPIASNIQKQTISMYIQEAADTYRVDPKLITAMIKNESNFQSDAVSAAGAAGLMQLMPSTARSLGVTDPFDPKQNIEAGTKYIKSLLDRYDGNLELALAAYNAGPGNVAKHGGVPPFTETRTYISKITSML